METSPIHPAAPDPLFPGGVTLPLCEVGGVQYPLDHRPGNLRPFVATLAVAAPPTAKHHTASTRNSTTTETYNQPDGEGGESDKISDTTTDT
jgi:hypothetical protein